MIEKLRNIAIIAHVDHGKTTLVDELLKQTQTLGKHEIMPERVMDSNELEQERGITILAKNTAIQWQDYRINIVDTPGHADFGGEVERVLSMVDSVLLLVDAVDGPMPQTRFVTQKAFAQGLKPILVINKIDRDGARPDWVVDQVFDLFVKLDATDEQLDFPIIYASAIQGRATLDLEQPSENLNPLLNTIIDSVAPPQVEAEGPTQIQISALDYSSYVGTIGIGRISRGSIKKNQTLTVISASGATRQGKVLQVFTHLGLQRVETNEAHAGDIIALTGIQPLDISDTLCDPKQVEALPPLVVDEPTVTMTFQVNDSPFAGKEGKYVTSRKLQERLNEELIHNVALRVKPTQDSDKFAVSGRGELHLSILLETMRREGYELAVSRPKVIEKEINGVIQEPYESLVLDVEDRHQGTIMEAIGARKGELKNMAPDGKGRVRLDYLIPARGLIGFQTIFMSMTSGTGLMYHVFDGYGPKLDMIVGKRQSGALVSNGAGKALAFALFNLQERGRLIIKPGIEVYEGMIVGLHSRDNDLVVNPLKAKKLTNIRAAGTDENILLTPPLNPTLEEALGLIDDDELVEITPTALRIRKKFLKESDRKRSSKV